MAIHVVDNAFRSMGHLCPKMVNLAIQNNPPGFSKAQMYLSKNPGTLKRQGKQVSHFAPVNVFFRNNFKTSKGCLSFEGSTIKFCAL